MIFLRKLKESLSRALQVLLGNDRWLLGEIDHLRVTVAGDGRPGQVLGQQVVSVPLNCLSELTFGA